MLEFDFNRFHQKFKKIYYTLFIVVILVLFQLILSDIQINTKTFFYKKLDVIDDVYIFSEKKYS